MANLDIVVYIWEFFPDRFASEGGRRPAADYGHAALKIVTGATNENNSPNYVYLSWWPNRHTGHQLSAGYGKTTENYDKFKLRETPGIDRSADAKYKFSSEALDKAAMIQFVNDLTRGFTKVSYLAYKGRFDAFRQNCSSTVAWALWRGGAGQYARWPGYWFWHPNNLALYCRDVAEGIKRRRGEEHATIVRHLASAKREPTYWQTWC